MGSWQIEEPEVVKLCLKMVMKERCAYLSEEAREFHSESIGPIINIYICLRYAGPAVSGSDRLRVC